MTVVVDKDDLPLNPETATNCTSSNGQTFSAYSQNAFLHSTAAPVGRNLLPALPCFWFCGWPPHGYYDSGWKAKWTGRIISSWKLQIFCLKISIFLCFCNIELKLCKTGDFRGFVSRYGQVFFMISGHFLSTSHLKLFVKCSRRSCRTVFHAEDDTVCASKNKKSRHLLR